MPSITNSSVSNGRLLGGSWLCREYGVTPVQPLKYVSTVGSRNSRREFNGTYENVFQPSYAPEESFSGHLEFMVKHERIHLEFLSRLFKVAGQNEIAKWVTDQPTGQYSRRSAWLYEWLTGNRLDVPDVRNAPYVNAIEPDRYWTATDRGKITRWHVWDNMPGTRAFCPMVMLTDRLQVAISAADARGAVSSLEVEFGASLLRRAAMWLTRKESRSSFEIEGEHDVTREDRFALAMDLHLGKLEDPFGEDLRLLQGEVLGPKALHYGLRNSPVFVGQVVRYREVVNYVAPSYENVPEMVSGLAETLKRTKGTDPLIRAAALSFGFVYIHPLSDGNGRVSRFVINDVLRRDGLVDEPLIVPVSATICNDMASYDRILDAFSAPFRRRYSEQWRFGNDFRYSDGLVSNFYFDAYEDALHAWRYLDLTDHAVYMAGVIGDTLRHEMFEEADFLRKHYLARERLSEVFEAGDNTLDRIIRSVSENKRITGKLAADYPQLADPDTGERVVNAVLSAIDGNRDPL
jgi:hypothetical protein